MDKSGKINNMSKQTYTKLDQILEHVKSDHKMLKTYIAGGIDNGRNIMLVYLTGSSAFKQPNWFGYNTITYNAQKIKDTILTTFEKNPGQYGYAILLGEQPDGSFIICIDEDIDTDCKDYVFKQFEDIFKRRNIHYYPEITKSGRYHIYVALDKLPEELKKLRRLTVSEECKKYKYNTLVQGEIELLGVSNPQTVTVYNGIINDEKPFFVEQLVVNSAEDFLEALKEFLGINEELNEIDYEDDIDDEEIETEETQQLDKTTIDKIVEFFKSVRKNNYTNGWEIDKIVSAVCVSAGMQDDDIYHAFSEIFQDEYDEKRTKNLIEKTKEKDPQRLPSIASVIYHAKEFLTTGQLTDEEKKLAEDLIKTLRTQSIGNFELPEYLINAEKVYFIASYEKQSKSNSNKNNKDNKNNRPYYRERWFIERNVDNVKQVWHVEIETSYPKNIYKPHRAVTYPKFVSIKTDIYRLLKEQAEVYEVIINDEFPYRPPFSFDRLEDIAIAIAKQCSRYKQRFDIQLFQEYLDIKIMEYLKKHNGRPTPCLISKTTGWNEDNTMFFHYDLNDEKHELHKDNPLYRSHKAESFNQQEQHEFVLKLLEEGELLGVLLVISVASIGLKPFNLQPLTCILAGNPGAGKTTASLIATSLFYKSDTILLNANATNVGIELTLSSLNSLPFVIDEGALADVGVSLKHTIFSVASGKGRTRGRKDLTVDTKDIISNVFWTTETTDIDEIKRGGAFRRMLYLVVEQWENFTKRYNLTDDEDRPNERFSGCGVDYIKFAVENLSMLEKRFNKDTRDFVAKYREITGIATTLYAGIILLEEYYSYRLNQKIVFQQLRNKVNQILEDTKKTFVLSKDNVVELLQQYLYNNQHRFSRWDQIKDGAGGIREDIKEPTSKEMLGEYDKTTQTYYISVSGFKTIARELEKERNILINALVKAGVIDSKDSIIYHSKVTKSKIRGYKLRFPEPPPTPPDEPANTIPPEQPPPDSEPPNEPSPPETPYIQDTPYTPVIPDIQDIQDNDPDIPNAIEQSDMEANNEDTYTLDYDTLDIADEAFSNINSVKPFERPQPILPTPPQLTDTQTSELKPDIGNTDTTEPDIDEVGDADISFEEQDTQEMIDTADDKDKKTIIIDEDKLDIFDVKDTSEIDDVSDLEERMKSIKPFSELAIGVLDIETTGLELSDQILAIAFDVFKGDETLMQYRFYLSDYNNDESKMVSSFLDTLAASNIDVLVGYNVYNFDLPMIMINDNEDKVMVDTICNIANVKLGDKQQQGYCIKVKGKHIEVIDAMYLTIKFDNVARVIPAQNYDLKSVAKFFGISRENRLVLGADEIRHCYYFNRELFNRYLDEDVRETYEIFKKLAPAYYYIKMIVPFDISFFTAFRSSTASIWEKILEKAYDDEYKNTLTADEKMSYEGGLVLVSPGLYKNVYKIDVASLYPSIMLNYQICSKKDIKKIGLIMLKAYTKLRLELKKKAKVYGDKEADLIQNSLKLLINSLYGFYGTAGYLFNDMESAAKIAAFGRKILKFMIDFIEKSGGVVIEADTDGIFYSARDGEEIFKELKQELNKINFDVELEYENCLMYVSDKKNYILITQSGDVIKKGSKFAGRDKNRLQTEFVVEYIRRYVKDKNKAEAYEKEIKKLIEDGQAYDWLKITRKVGKGDKTIIEDAKLKGIALEQGSVVSFVYKDYKKKKYTFDFESEGDKIYDINYYINEFEKLMREIKDVINSTKKHS